MFSQNNPTHKGSSYCVRFQLAPENLPDLLMFNLLQNQTNNKGQLLLS